MKSLLLVSHFVRYLLPSDQFLTLKKKMSIKSCVIKSIQICVFEKIFQMQIMNLIQGKKPT